MVGIGTVVWFVFVAIVVVGILAILWWLIGYCERKMAEAGSPMPMVWAVVRVVFVVLCAFLAVSALMALLGYPLVDFGPRR